MRARVTVTLKTGVLDPQGKAIEGALASLGVEGVTNVRQGKLFDVELDAADAAEAERVLRAAGERLLANTVIENFRVELDPSSLPAPVPAAEPAADAAPPAEHAQDAPFSPDQPVPSHEAAAAVDPDRATEVAASDSAIPREGHP